MLTLLVVTIFLQRIYERKQKQKQNTEQDTTGKKICLHLLLEVVLKEVISGIIYYVPSETWFCNELPNPGKTKITL